VYGPQGTEERINFLQELRDVRAGCSGLWLLVGDFNMIYKDEDKNNSNLNLVMMGHFRRFIDDVTVKGFPLAGRKFT
jgi:hypothetical protein